MPAHAGQY